LNSTILLFLIQDGITNGAIYALLGLALVLVFTVTRVILIPQGEFVTYGALTYATLCSGEMPGTAKLAVAMGSPPLPSTSSPRGGSCVCRASRALSPSTSSCPAPCSR
jgi:branched-subunit amino acid ABC-type transport system permease component